jgi:hypothetical protein
MNDAMTYTVDLQSGIHPGARLSMEIEADSEDEANNIAIQRAEAERPQDAPWRVI